jgi:hypothetical protein
MRENAQCFGEESQLIVMIGMRNEEKTIDAQLKQL